MVTCLTHSMSIATAMWLIPGYLEIYLYPLKKIYLESRSDIITILTWIHSSTSCFALTELFQLQLTEIQPQIRLYCPQVKEKYKGKIGHSLSISSFFLCQFTFKHIFLPGGKNGSGSTRLIKVLSTDGPGMKRTTSSLPSIYFSPANGSYWPCLANCPYLH